MGSFWIWLLPISNKISILINFKIIDPYNMDKNGYSHEINEDTLNKINEEKRRKRDEFRRAFNQGNININLNV